VSEDSAAAPAIPLETLLPHLTEHFLDPRTARIAERDEKFRTLRFRCHQIFYVHDFLESRLRIPVSIGALAAGFGCAPGRVKKALAHGLEPPETRGRHLALSDEVEQELVNWIKANAAKSRAVTPRDLREHVTTQHSLLATRGWEKWFMGRHMEEACKKRSTFKFLAAFLTKPCDASLSSSMAFQPNWILIWTKSGYPTGKIAHQSP
jgi:hypothetical protein